MKNQMNKLVREMTREETEYFLLGVQRTIVDKGLVQKEVALTAGVSPENFSKVLNKRIGSSAKYRRRICEVLGVTEEDMVRVGSPTQPPVQVAIPFPAAIPTDYLPTDEVVQYLARVSSSMSEVGSSYIKLDARLKYWMQMVEAMPVPVIVTRDGIVFTQNRKSRAIWDGLGKPLCSGCTDTTCKELGCDIKDAIDRGRDVEKYKMIGDGYYKVQTSHFAANGHEYTIIVTTLINECLAATKKLSRIADERAFLEKNQFEPPEYYAGSDRVVSYVNNSFLNLFDITREDMKTTDDFHIMLSRKLFYHQHVAKAADEVRMSKKATEITAKLSNNKTVTFIFRPHVKDGELVGVLVMVLTPELYEAFGGGR